MVLNGRSCPGPIPAFYGIDDVAKLPVVFCQLLLILKKKLEFFEYIKMDNLENSNVNGISCYFSQCKVYLYINLEKIFPL
jgi:hypothetical protein